MSAAILSIQSHVAMGHVGNSAAVPLLQGLFGRDVWAVHTVLFSSHPGWSGWKGHVVEAAHLKDILDGLELRWREAPAQALLTGYFGNHEQVRVTADFIKRVRAEHPDVPYVCDPVLGDHGQRYVDGRVQDAFESMLLPLATHTCPNTSELAWLTGMKTRDVEEATLAARALSDKFGCRVLATGVRDGNEEHMLSVHGEDVAHVTSTHHPRDFAGCGDVFGATYTSCLLDSMNEQQRLERCAEVLDGLLGHTMDCAQRELALVSYVREQRESRAD